MFLCFCHFLKCFFYCVCYFIFVIFRNLMFFFFDFFFGACLIFVFLIHVCVSSFPHKKIKPDYAFAMQTTIKVRIFFIFFCLSFRVFLFIVFKKSSNLGHCFFSMSITKKKKQHKTAREWAEEKGHQPVVDFLHPDFVK